MFISGIILGIACLFAACYASALGLVYVFNAVFFHLPFDVFSYFQCPFSGTCIEYGAELKMWIWGLTVILFLISGIAAPALYHHRTAR